MLFSTPFSVVLFLIILLPSIYGYYKLHTTLNTGKPRLGRLIKIPQKYLSTTLRNERVFVKNEKSCITKCFLQTPNCFAVNGIEIAVDQYDCTMIFNDFANLTSSDTTNLKDYKTAIHVTKYDMFCGKFCDVVGSRKLCGDCKCETLCFSRAPYICNCKDTWPPIKSCSEVVKSGKNISGIYRIKTKTVEFHGFCKIESDGRASLLLLQRWRDAPIFSTDNYDNYKSGFGEFHDNFWIGLTQLHSYVASNPQNMILYEEVNEANVMASREIRPGFISLLYSDDEYFAAFGLPYRNGKYENPDECPYDRRSFKICNQTEGSWWKKSCEDESGFTPTKIFVKLNYLAMKLIEGESFPPRTCNDSLQLFPLLDSHHCLVGYNRLIKVFCDRKFPGRISVMERRSIQDNIFKMENVNEKDALESYVSGFAENDRNNMWLGLRYLNQLTLAFRATLQIKADCKEPICMTKFNDFKIKFVDGKYVMTYSKASLCNPDDADPMLKYNNTWFGQCPDNGGYWWSSGKDCGPIPTRGLIKWDRWNSNNDCTGFFMYLKKQ